MFTSAIPSGMPIIDESNAHIHIGHIENGEFSAGYVKRDFEAVPLGSVRPLTRKTPYPRSEWAERIKDKEKRKEGLADLHRYLKVPVLDQDRTKFCWFYGTTKAVMMNYARLGKAVPHLSATSGAAKVTGYRNRGGTATEALQGIEQFGISTVNFWPEHDINRAHDGPEQQGNAELHKVTAFEELPSQSFPDLITSVIDDDPTTIGLAWWGHLVCALQARVLGRDSFGIEFVNSWNITYGKDGFGILEESKAIAFEQYALRGITPSGGV